MPSELVHQHRHAAFPSRDDRLLRRDPKAFSLHLNQKLGRGLATRVGDQGRGTRLQQPRDQAGEQRYVPALVKHVRGVHEVEGALQLPELRGAPVEQASLGLASEVRPRVVGREVEGGLVVVRRQRSGGAFERSNARETDTAAQLDRPLARKVFAVEASGEGRGARPELRPVRQALVAGELLFVEEGIGGDGMDDGVGLLPNLYARLGDTGPSAKVSFENLQAPPVFQGFELLAKGGGEG